MKHGWNTVGDHRFRPRALFYGERGPMKCSRIGLHPIRNSKAANAVAMVDELEFDFSRSMDAHPHGGRSIRVVDREPGYVAFANAHPDNSASVLSIHG